MTRRRTAVLLLGGLTLVVAGSVSIAVGVHGRSALTVVGILLAIAGLVCLRIIYWSVRVRAMTRAGIAMSDHDGHASRDHPGGGSQSGKSGSGSAWP